MKHRKYLYGSLGLLSLLGFIGIFTEERGFLAFFAFAVDFEYFFIKSDEMLEEYMNRCVTGFLLRNDCHCNRCPNQLFHAEPNCQRVLIGRFCMGMERRDCSLRLIDRFFRIERKMGS